MATLLVAQLSVAVAVPIAVDVLLSWQFTVAFDGHVITGAVTSCTVIVCTHVELFPDGSVANPALASYYNYTITRTWKATDPSGNSSTCVQTIKVQDVTVLVIICQLNAICNCQVNNT